MKKKTCKDHEQTTHDCVERIINDFKHEAAHVPREERMRRIVLSCENVESVLVVTVAKAAHHRKDHVPQWGSLVYRQHRELICEQCGVFFSDEVIEAARELKIL